MDEYSDNTFGPESSGSLDLQHFADSAGVWDWKNHLKFPEPVSEGEEKTLWSWIVEALPRWYPVLEDPVENLLYLLRAGGAAAFFSNERKLVYINDRAPENGVYSVLSVRMDRRGLFRLIESMMDSDECAHHKLGWLLVNLAAFREFLPYAESLFEYMNRNPGCGTVSILPEAVDSLWILGSERFIALTEGLRDTDSPQIARTLLSWEEGRPETWDAGRIKKWIRKLKNGREWIWLKAPGMLLFAARSGLNVENVLFRVIRLMNKQLVNRTADRCDIYSVAAWCVETKSLRAFDRFENHQKYLELMWSGKTEFLYKLESDFRDEQSNVNKYYIASAIASLRELSPDEINTLLIGSSQVKCALCWAALTDPSLESTVTGFIHSDDKLLRSIAQIVLIIIRNEPVYNIGYYINQISEILIDRLREQHPVFEILLRALRFKRMEIPPFLAEYELMSGRPDILAAETFYKDYPYMLWKRLVFPANIIGVKERLMTFKSALFYNFLMAGMDKDDLQPALEGLYLTDDFDMNPVYYLMLSGMGGPRTLLGKALEKLYYRDAVLSGEEQRMVLCILRGTLEMNKILNIVTPAETDSYLLLWIFDDHTDYEVSWKWLDSMAEPVSPLLKKYYCLHKKMPVNLSVIFLAVLADRLDLPADDIGAFVRVFSGMEKPAHALIFLMRNAGNKNVTAFLRVFLELGYKAPWIARFMDVLSENYGNSELLSLIGCRKNPADISRLLEMSRIKDHAAEVHRILDLIAVANPGLGLLVLSESTFNVRLSDNYVASVLENLKTRVDEDFMESNVGRIILFHRYQSGKTLPAVLCPLGLEDFMKLAFRLKISFVDQQTGSAVAEVTRLESGDILNYLFRDNRIAVFQASWC